MPFDILYIFIQSQDYKLLIVSTSDRSKFAIPTDILFSNFPLSEIRKYNKIFI